MQRDWVKGHSSAENRAEQKKKTTYKVLELGGKLSVISVSPKDESGNLYVRFLTSIEGAAV